METLSPVAATELDDPQVVITRIFDAPRELVFAAWTDPNQLVRWYAPQGCTIEYRQIDIREGGTFHSCIRTPNGFHCWCIGEYREIIVPEKIVCTMVISNENGDRIQSVDAGHESDWPAETILTVTFADQAGKTKLTLHQNVRQSVAQRTGALPSWMQMLDRLAAQLEIIQ